MNMGSLAETYLTAYGWRLYGVMYLVFWVSKVMLYPIARFFIDVAIEYAIRGGESKMAVRDVFIRFMIMVSVFILGAIPMVPYDVSSTVVEMPGCGPKDNPSQKAQYDKRFGGGSNIYVPALPYLAMLASSGVNMAVLKSLPCAADMIAANQASNNLAMPSTEAGRALRDETAAFGQQCYALAKEYDKTNSSDKDPLRAEVVRQLKGEYMPKTQMDTNQLNALPSEYRSVIEVNDIKQGQEYLGSNYYNKVLYTDDACNSFHPKNGNGFKQVDLEKTWTDMCLWIRNNRTLTNYAQAATPSNANSQLQQKEGVDGVRCGDWWNDSSGSDGLRNRLAFAGFQAKIDQFVGTLGIDNRSNVEPLTGKQIDVNQYDRDPEGYVRQLFSGLNEAEKESMVLQMSEAAQREDYQVLSGKQKATIITTGIFSFFTNIGGSIGNISGLVTSTAIAKAVVTLAHPVLLMLVYALWLLYLVIGEFKGTVLMKGLLMIFVIKFCTSVFAIADRLSNELVLLLVPNFTDTLWNVIKSSPDVAIIYMVGTLLYMAVPVIMMYIVATAGGPDTSVASRAISNSSKQTGEEGGKIAGGGTKAGISASTTATITARQRYFSKKS